jgi:hypothetical protein
MADFETISNDNFFTVVVDPNGLNKENVRHEDLFIYVDFRAMPKSRSIIETDGSITNDVFNPKGISFIASQKQESGSYLTTNYTNIGGGSPQEEEAFGIKSIDIEYGKNLAPIVNISFLDVRGAALFNGYETVDDKGVLDNNSQFAAFFSMPYPVFQLTVKGYYGKAVSYCLHLMKWSSSFNAENGSFEIKATFQGYTFAFLEDILIGHVMALTTSDVGQKALLKNNTISVTELITRLGKLTSISEEFKKTSKNFDELKFLNSLILEVDKIQKEVGLPITSKNPSAFGNLLPIAQLKANEHQVFIRDVGIISSEKADVLKIIVEDLEKFIKGYNDFIGKNIGKYPYSNQYKIDNFNIVLPASSYKVDDTLVNKIIDEVKKDVNYQGDNIITLSALNSRLNLQPNSAKEFYLLNFLEFRKELVEISEELKKKKILLEQAVNEELNKDIEKQLGLKLNIQSIFNILLGNVDAYLSVIYDHALAADNPDIQQNRLSAIKGGTLDQTNVSRLYPFPAVFDSKDGKEVWIGDIVGEDNPYFPEIALVKTTLNSMVSSNGKSVTEKEKESAKNAVVAKGESWIPLYTTDGSVPYSSINTLSFNGNEVPVELASEIVKRITYAYNQTGYRDGLINNISQIEAAYAFFKTNEALIRNILNNTDSNTFADTVMVKAKVSQLSLPQAVKPITINSLNPYDILVEELNENVQGNIDTAKKALRIETVKKDLAKNVSDIIATYKSPIEDIFIPSKFKTVHRKLGKKSYMPKGEISDLLWNDKTKALIKKVYKARTSNDLLQEKPVNGFISAIINDLSVFDGQINPSIDFIVKPNENAKFANLAGNSIGLGLVDGVDTDKLLSSQYYYSVASPLEKSYLFLLTMPISSIEDFYKILDLGGEYNLTKMQLAWVGAQFWRAKYLKDFGSDIFDNIVGQLTTNEAIYISGLIKKGTETLKYLPDLTKFNDDFIKILVDFYEKWSAVDYNTTENLILTDFTPPILGIENIVYNYRTFFSEGAQFLSSAKYDGFKFYYDELLKKIVEPYSITVNDVNGIRKNIVASEVLSDAQLKQYLTTWINTYKKLVADFTNSNSLFKSPDDIVNTGGFYIADKDIKIAAYRHFKNLYDKWIGGTMNGKPYNSCQANSNKSLIERFHFVDTAFNPVGDRAVVDPKTIQTLAKNPSESLSSFLSTLGQASGFAIFALPSFIHYKTAKEGLDMWKPQTSIENIGRGASYVCVYGNPSGKSLDLGKKAYYVNDGFDFRDSTIGNIPDGFKKRVPLDVDSVPYDKDKYNLVVFRVGYADQNQSIFKTISVSQEEHKETAEYMAAMADMFDSRGGTKPLYKNANLYNLFALRSYKCTVTCMGNMMVHCLNYFQLDNMPFYHGAYQISKVKHTIVPNDITTTFDGYRMPRYTTPVISSITTYVSVPLSETLFTDEERQKSVIRPISGKNYSEAEIAIANANKGAWVGNNFGYNNPVTVSTVVTPNFTGSLINNSELQILNNNPLGLIQASNKIDRSGGLWTTSSYSVYITATDSEVASIMNKTRGQGLFNLPNETISLPIAKFQTVDRSKFKTLDAYLKPYKVPMSVIGKGRVARPYGDKANCDIVYGFIDKTLLPSGRVERADDKQRAAFLQKNIRGFQLPFGLKTALDYGTTSANRLGGEKFVISLHKDVGDSFVYAMKEVLGFYGIENIQKLGLNIFSGSFVFRTISEGSDPSLHAYGIAVDFLAPLGLLNSKGRDALFSQAPYTAFIDILEKWGWYSLGRYGGKDWMHFQAAHYGVQVAKSY